MHSVRHDPDAAAIKAQQATYLICGELRDSDDEIGIPGRPPGVLREPGSEFRRRVHAGHDEEIVKGRDSSGGQASIEPLIERVKEIGPKRGKGRLQQTAADIREWRRPHSPKLLGTVAMYERNLRVRGSEAAKNFA
jgi:hypothetical protein